MFFFPIYKLYCLSFYYLNNILHKLFKEHFSTLFNICMFTTFRPYIGVREMFINSSGGTKQTTKKYTIKKLSVNFSFIFAQKAILRKSKFDFYLFFFFSVFFFFFFFVTVACDAVYYVRIPFSFFLRIITHPVCTLHGYFRYQQIFITL